MLSRPRARDRPGTTRDDLQTLLAYFLPQIFVLPSYSLPLRLWCYLTLPDRITVEGKIEEGKEEEPCMPTLEVCDRMKKLLAIFSPCSPANPTPTPSSLLLRRRDCGRGALRRP